MILTILKIIGIVLLSIIGLLLVIVLALCFVPFRYKINASKDDSLIANVKITYLLHFISLKVIYDKKLTIEARILGIRVYKKTSEGGHGKDKDEDILEDLDEFEEDSKDKKSSKKADNEIDASEEANDSATILESSDSDIPSKGDSNDESNINGSGVDASESSNEYSIDEEISDNKKKSKLFRKLSRLNQKIAAIPSKLVGICENIEEKIDGLFDTIAYYECLFSKKGTEYVIQFLKEKIIKLLKHICPRKCKIDFDYSSEDPDKAGKMWEIYGMVMPFLPGKNRINIGFDEEVLRFKIMVKGRIFLGYVGLIGLQILFNKKVKKFIKLLKREDKR